MIALTSAFNWNFSKNLVRVSLRSVFSRKELFQISMSSHLFCIVTLLLSLELFFVYKHKPSLSSLEKKMLPTQGFELPTLDSNFQLPDWNLTTVPPCKSLLVMREYSCLFITVWLKPLIDCINTKTWNELKPPSEYYFYHFEAFSDNFVNKFLLAPCMTLEMLSFVSQVPMKSETNTPEK